jgi:glycosyltransferase involved in cell wall biosynthesis
MIIGVDYTAAVWQGAGIGRYTRELIRAAAPLDAGLRYVLFYAAGGLPAASPYLAELRALCAANPNLRARPIPLNPRVLTIIWQRLRLPLRAELFAGRIDLLHAPDFVLPPTRARALLTVHDLTFMVHPETADAGLRRYLAASVPRSLRRADLVLVDSQATAADLGRLLGVAPARTRLLYPGVEARFRPLPAAEVEPVRAELGLPAQFLLFVSTIEPRKNLVRLIAAFDRLIGDGAHPGLDLVIAGRRGWMYDEVFAAVERHGLTGRVRFLDFVADRQLPALYNLARAFVYPSLYEGFGFPALEAMACGTPVVTAAVSSLPEVVGTAAVLVDPLDVESIAAGMAQALREPERLRAAGPPQARRFSWEASGRTLVEIYHGLRPRH